LPLTLVFPLLHATFNGIYKVLLFSYSQKRDYHRVAQIQLRLGLNHTRGLPGASFFIPGSDKYGSGALVYWCFAEQGTLPPKIMALVSIFKVNSKALPPICLIQNSALPVTCYIIRNCHKIL
jgi:hypothetical protein